MIHDLAGGCPERLSRSSVGASSLRHLPASVCTRLLLVQSLAPPTARQNPAELLTRAVVSANQLLPRPNLPRRRWSKGSGARMATSSFWEPHLPPCRFGLVIPVRCSLNPACAPEIDRSWIRRPTCRFPNRSFACLAAAVLAFGPIVTKEVLRTAGRDALNAPSEWRPPRISTFDVIDACGIFVTGQDTHRSCIAQGNGGPTRKTWILILRTKGGTLAGGAKADGRGEEGNQAGVEWLQTERKLEVERGVESKVAIDGCTAKG